MKNLFLLSLVFILTADICFGQEQSGFVSEGFMLSGIEGSVFFESEKQDWYFELSNDVNDSFNRISAGTKLLLLPSAALEKFCNDVNDRIQASCRLWGRVTRYKNKNYIFPSHILRLAKTTLLESGVEPEKNNNVEEQSKEEVSVNDQEDEIVIPEDVLEKLSSRKIIRTESSSERVDVPVDTVISDRMAVLKTTSDGKLFFILDSIGQNIGDVSLKALPTQALELAEIIQIQSPEKVRFIISGLLTKYKGEYYILLQRSSRTYNYQNFAR
ncbi:MAG: hypothetical protein ACYTEE_04470 [Planctomycetota bacterium]|jgi:hypothetical protein